MCNDCQQQELKGCTWFELVDWLRMLINLQAAEAAAGAHSSNALLHTWRNENVDFQVATAHDDEADYKHEKGVLHAQRRRHGFGEVARLPLWVPAEQWDEVLLRDDGNRKRKLIHCPNDLKSGRDARCINLMVKRAEMI